MASKNSTAVKATKGAKAPAYVTDESLAWLMGINAEKPKASKAKADKPVYTPSKWASELLACLDEIKALVPDSKFPTLKLQRGYKSTPAVVRKYDAKSGKKAMPKDARKIADKLMVARDALKAGKVDVTMELAKAIRYANYELREALKADAPDVFVKKTSVEACD